MSSLVENQGFLASRHQSIALLGLLGILVVTCLITDLLARNKGLEHWLMIKSRQVAEKNGTGFSNTGNFIDYEERILLDEVPHADYSRGGVYFFGTSNMKWAFDTLDLPAEQKQLIGNYGIGASSHTTQLRWIRYLIEQHGFLKAGERDLVIIGVSFQCGGKDDPSTGYFASLLRRQGLFETTPDGRVVPIEMNPIERWLRVEKARSGGSMWNYGRLGKNWLEALVGWSSRTPHDGAAYRRYWRLAMGEQWQQNMDVEVERLKDTILLLRTHHARVKVVLLPQGTWMDKLPFKARYETLIRSLGQETSTPLIDLSHAMPDEAFVDSSHFTVEGQKKFRGLIMGEIIGHLQKLELR